MSKTIMASCVLARSGLGSLIRRASAHHGFMALNYHRVGDGAISHFDHGVFSTTPAMFERQLRFLKKECDIVMPHDIGHLRRRPRGNYVMVTFDDGYRDNYEVAFPILKSLDVPAIFFVATGFIEQPRISWWDEIAWMVQTSKVTSIGPMPALPIRVNFDPPFRRRAVESLLAIYKKLPPGATQGFLDAIARESGTGRCPASEANRLWMTWDMLRQMRREGMVIGGHTVNHPILSHLSRPEQELEILGCARTLEQQLGEPMRYFSYPRGKPDAFNGDTRACLRKTQVEYAFSYYGGMNRRGDHDPYDIRRVAVEVDTPIEHFEAMVTLPLIFA